MDMGEQCWPTTAGPWSLLREQRAQIVKQQKQIDELKAEYARREQRI